MGGRISQSSTANDVADYVSDLGDGYDQYRVATVKDGIDGSLLAAVISQGKNRQLIDEYVTKTVHGVILQSKLDQFIADMSGTLPQLPTLSAANFLSGCKSTLSKHNSANVLHVNISSRKDG